MKSTHTTIIAALIRVAMTSRAVRMMTAALALTGAATAQAATVTVHSVLDLTQLNVVNGVSAIGSAPDFASFRSGDTIILNIDFLGNQTLRLDSILALGGAVLTNIPDCPHSTASLVLNNYSGGGTGAVSSGQYQGCAPQVGAQFPLGPPGLGGGPLEFSGVTFTFADLSQSDSGVRIASGGRLDIAGVNGSIGQLASPTGVPEPMVWAMLIVGFGLVGVQVRRRRNGGTTIAA